MEADKHRQKSQAWAEEAWKLRVEGWTQQRIAAKLNVSHQRVSQILQKKEKELHAEFILQAEEIKARQTERLDHLYDRLTTQFEESCRDGTGNPALLAQALKALGDQRAIWGVEAAKKSELSGPAGGPIEIDANGIRDDLQRRMVRLAAAGSLSQLPGDDEPGRT